MSSWTEQEVEAAVRDYFDMLNAELKGEAYNKSNHNRILRESLDSRTKGSVERKHQNISAILLEMELPYIDGYKPLGNYQAMLKDTVRKYIQRHDAVLAGMRTMASQQAYQEQKMRSVWDVLVDPPERESETEEEADEETLRIARKYNFPEQERRNSILGRLGEMFVLDFEKSRLVDRGMGELANHVKWISEEEGDGAGYDIQSFDDHGNAKLIEVKTTNYGRSFPFMVTQNEVRVSEDCADQYSLYRVFTFSRQPKLFMLPGAISGNCKLEAKTYKASFGKVA